MQAAVNLVAALFAGLASTVFEMAWARGLVPALGTGHAALGAVAAAHLSGLGLGGVWASRWADTGRTRRRLAFLSMAAAVAGWAATAAMPLLPEMLSPVLHAAGAAGGLALLARFGAAAAVVLLPSILIGAMPPLLIRLWRPRRAAARSGGLCAIMTLGALAGVAVAGFVIIPAWGVRATGAFAALLLLIVAAIARLGRDASSQAMNQLPPTAEVSAATAGSILTGLLLSGSAGLALQVIWGRIGTFTLGNDAHATAWLLLAVLGGQAAGAGLHGIWLSRIRCSWVVLASLYALGAMAAVLGVRLAGAAYAARGVYVASLAEDPHLNLAACRLLHAGMLAMVPSVFAGAAFASAAQILGAGGPRPGRAFGAAAAINAAGCVLGALFSWLVLLPRAGAAAATVSASWALLAAAVLVAAVPLRRWSARIPILIAGGLAAAVMPAVLSADRLLPRMVAWRKESMERLHFAEGAAAAVSVWRDKVDGVRRLCIDQISEVPTDLVSLQAFKLLGHLPLLVHDAPKDVLMITFGGGIAAGAALAHPIRRLEAVDIEPGVFEAARHFRDVNRGALDDPRLVRVAADGRNHLLLSSRRFDVIVSDSTHPRSGDSWVLYTAEFYRLCRERLAGGGVMAQWLPVHDLSVAAYAGIVGTFIETFPHATLWFVKEYTILMGAPEPWSVDVPRLRRRLGAEAVRSDLDSVHLGTEADLLGTYLASGGDLARLASGVPANTDDRTWVQYEPLDPVAFPTLARRLDSIAGPVASQIAGLNSEAADDRALLEALDRQAAARSLLLQQRWEEAAALVPESVRLAAYVRDESRRDDDLLSKLNHRPDDPDLLLPAGQVLLRRGEPGGATELLARAAALRPEASGIHYLLAVAARAAGDPRRAEDAAGRAVTLDSGFVEAWRELGLARLQRGDLSGAREALGRAARLRPGDPFTRRALEDLSVISPRR